MSDAAHPLDDAEVERVLVVTAHPDDVDFAAAAVVAGWTARGIEVTYCVITDGQSGGFDPDLDRDAVPEVRRREQRAAAAKVGVRDLRFLGYVDGGLTVTHDLVRDVARVVRQVRPQRVLIQSPERDWTRLAPSHPDHLAGGEAAIQALFPAAGNRFAFPDLLDQGHEPWDAEEVWLMEHPDCNHAVDVTDHAAAMMEALLCHGSQHHDQSWLQREMRTKLADTAAEFGLAKGRLALKFAVYPLP
jgi:LmbE family N-acetylglucosaminyl deacetylase